MEQIKGINNPKVSVIVPVYNTEKYLVKCLDSLVNQTIEEIEIIVVNDGSTDKSPDIINEYYDKYPNKMKVIHKENGGQASARNIALDISTGEYIGFMDSDDFVKTDMFEKLYNCALINDADYVGCGYTDIMENNGGYKTLGYIANKPCKTNKQMFIGGQVSPIISFYRGDILRNNKIHFPEGYIYEDTAFWLYIIPYINKPAYLNESLAYRVCRENSTMTSISAKKVSDIFYVMSCIVDYYKENNFWDEYRDEVEYFCVRVLLCSSMERIGKVSDKADRKHLIERTYTYLGENFSDYKSNKILRQSRGIKNMYIKYSCPLLSKLLCMFIR